jgi:predicted RNase H-like HicB family nuclease
MKMNKDIKYYMALPYEIRVAPPSEPDGDWFADIPLLDGCTTQAPKDKLLDMIEESKEIWLMDAIEDGDTIPEPVQEPA